MARTTSSPSMRVSRTDLDVLYETISISLALSALEGARGTRLLILDACRNNPFTNSMRLASNSRALGRGLARVEPSVGTIVAYAAKEGTTADDGDGEHSPFAAALLQHIEEPGIDVQFLFRKVRDTVLETTNGNQEPFTYGSLPGRSRAPLAEKPAPPAVPAAPATTASRSTEPSSGAALAAEVAFWNTIEDSGDRALYDSYLKQFPDGAFASLARIFIDRIDAEAAAKAAAKEPAPVVVADVPAAPAPAPEPAPPPAPVIQAVTPSPPAAGRPNRPRLSRPLMLRPRSDRSPHCRRTLFPRRRRRGPRRNSFATSRKNWSASAAAAAGRMACGGRRADPPRSPSPGSPTSRSLRLIRRKIFFSALKQQGDRVCPLVCGARFDAIGDNCVLKTCPSGEKLGSNGSCFKPPEVKQPATKNASKATSGSRCRVESVMQCIDRKTRARGQGRSAPTGALFGPECNNPERRLRICR